MSATQGKMRSHEDDNYSNWAIINYAAASQQQWSSSPIVSSVSRSTAPSSSSRFSTTEIPSFQRWKPASSSTPPATSQSLDSAFTVAKAQETRKRMKFSKFKRREPEEVKITANLKKFDEKSGKLKCLRSFGSVTVNVSTSVGTKELVDAIVRQYSLLYDDFKAWYSRYTFNLLYTPGDRLADFLPGGGRPFVLEEYKKLINKSYTKLRFSICTNVDYFSFISHQKIYDSDFEELEEESDGVNSVPGRESRTRSHVLQNESAVSQNDGPLAVEVSGESSIHPQPPENESTSDDTVIVHVGGTSTNPTSSGSETTISYHENVGTEFNEVQYNLQSPQQMYANFLFCNEVPRNNQEAENSISDEGVSETSNDDDRVDDDNGQLVESLKNIAVAEGLVASDETMDNPVRLKVRRNFIWTDAKVKLRQVERKGEWNKLMKIQFVGEPAVDEGGPRREFITLLHRYMHDSSMFAGLDSKKCFTHNFTALKDRDFALCGKVIAWSILQGCPSPAFFSEPVTDYILYGELSKLSPDISLVPDYTVRHILQELDAISDPEEFQQKASGLELRFAAGYTKPSVTFDDKKDFIDCICLHYSILSALPELEQFIDGLAIFGFLDAVRAEPEKARSIFMETGENIITADAMEYLFHVEFSPPGSNRRAAEEAIDINRSRYFEEVDDGEVIGVLVDPITNEESQIIISLSMILQFITGSPRIPTLGFAKQPVITFNHTDVHRKLHANTCGPQLILPANDVLKCYESFKEEFTSCMLNSPGFGNV